MEIYNPPGFADKVLGAPVGWDPATKGECVGLPVKVVEGSFISLWKPTPEELFDLNRGMPIMLHVHSSVHPPVSLSVLLPEKEYEGRG